MRNENQLIKSLTGKENMAATSVQDWQNLVGQYPYFAAAQYFLAKKMKEEKSADALPHLHRAALHYSDIQWLQYLLMPTPVQAVLANDATLEPVPQTTLPTTEEEPPSRLSSVLEAQLAQFKKPVQQTDALAIEAKPLFKTDYFASQGILYVKRQDELGVKVKRFTDWLKEIKKNDQEVPLLQTTAEEEKQIIAQATASLKVKEVLTESMAEVLVQQGKKISAVAVYKKLSLLYPEKSIYFASKIDSLL